MDLDLQGNIEKFTLPEILQLIAASRKSGTLGIQKDDSIVMMYFDKGEVVYGYGPRQTFHLGQALRERGLLTAEQLDEAVNIQAKTENTKRLGEILVNRGFIDRADLETVVRKQVEELLYSLLSWQNGSFKFYEDQFPTDEEVTVRLSVENVILEGLRRLDEWNLIRETLPDFEAVYVISASQGGRARAVTLHADEWNVMALTDGRRTVNQICERSGISREDTLKRLAQLKLAGLLTQIEKKEESPSGDLDKMVNRLSGLFDAYLTQKRSDRTAPRTITRTVVGEAE
ncbi:MAG TPA: DUF4388 domain-containing protein [Acidobacteriota bacterium]|nr:DUF4388 domain-containing protein [Acidobacteriota bacterium]